MAERDKRETSNIDVIPPKQDADTMLEKYRLYQDRQHYKLLTWFEGYLGEYFAKNWNDPTLAEMAQEGLRTIHLRKKELEDEHGDKTNTAIFQWTV